MLRIAPMRGGISTPTFVLATRQAVYVVSAIGGSLGCAEVDDDACIEVLRVDPEDARGLIRDVAVLDWDRDGLDDLAIARDAGLDLLSQDAREDRTNVVSLEDFDAPF
jgi:hypothetical protein